MRGEFAALTAEEAAAFAAEPPLDIGLTADRCRGVRDADELYGAFRAAGLAYGPSFRRLEQVRVGGGETLGTLRPADGPAGWQGLTAVLDAGAAGSRPATGRGRPAGAAAVRRGPGDGAALARTRPVPRTPGAPARTGSPCR